MELRYAPRYLTIVDWQFVIFPFCFSNLNNVGIEIILRRGSGILIVISKGKERILTFEKCILFNLILISTFYFQSDKSSLFERRPEFIIRPEVVYTSNGMEKQ